MNMPQITIKPPVNFLLNKTNSQTLSSLPVAKLRELLIKSEPKMLIINAYDKTKRGAIKSYCSAVPSDTKTTIYTLSEFQGRIQTMDKEEDEKSYDALRKRDYYDLFKPENFFYSILKNENRYKIYYKNAYLKALNPDRIYYIKNDADTNNKNLDILCFTCNDALFFVHLYFYENYLNLHSDIEDSRRRLFTFFTGFTFPQRKVDKTLLTLGCDPELLLYKKDKDGMASYKDFLNAEGTLRNRCREVGLDACHELAEIRPTPGKNAHQITENIRKRITSLAEHHLSRSDVFVEAGGGCRRSIGGHIHLGHPDLQNNVNKCKALYKMLDDFLYYPIRLNVHGGMRQWGLVRDVLTNQTQQSILHSLTNTKDVHDVIKGVSKKNKSGFSSGGYDSPNMYRSKPHGIEYRSLPSFIASPEFTKLVFTITQNATYKFFDLINERKNFMYWKPPTKKDYHNFLTPAETDSFFEHLDGSKNDLFLKDVLESWGVKIDPKERERFLSIIFDLMSDSTLERMARKLQPSVDLVRKRTVQVCHTDYIPNNKFYFDIITMEGNWLTYPSEVASYVNSRLQSPAPAHVLILTSRAMYRKFTVRILEKMVKFALQLDAQFRERGNCWRAKSANDMNFNYIPPTGFSAIDIDLRERVLCAV